MTDSGRYLSLALLGFLMVFAGCGPKLPSDLPKLYPAQIEVVADGEKLAGATVSLYPMGDGESVGGLTDGNGIAKLQTRGKYPGAPAGQYKVCVNWAVTVEGKTSQNPPPTDPVELDRYNKRVEYERSAIPALEPIYKDPKNSPLEVEIKEGTNQLTVGVKKLANIPGSL